MTQELVLGIIVALIGSALLIGSPRITRAMAQGHREDLDSKPHLRAMNEESLKHSPRWMKSERFPAFANGVYVVGTAVIFLLIGATLIARGV